MRFSSALTSKGQRWTAVTFDDANLEVDRASVTVLNSPPRVASVLISAVPGDHLAASVEVSDDDQDNVNLLFSWTQHEEVIGTAELQPWGDLQRGDKVMATVTPFDGEITGQPVSSPVQVVPNQPPVLNVWVEPSAPTAVESVACVTTAHDGDGDSVEILTEWFVNGEAVTGDTGPTLEGAGLQRGDEVQCRVTASDLIGGVGSATAVAVTVQNSPPTVTGAQIHPNPAVMFTDLSCTA